MREKLTQQSENLYIAEYLYMNLAHKQ